MAIENAGQPPWLRIGADHVTLEVTVRPSAGRRGIVSIRPTGPVIALKSAPEKGRANGELLEFIAELLEVPPAAVTLIKGYTTRRKVVRVDTRHPAALSRTIMALANAPRHV
jgi:uncharacterized protein (TIGR00251 family)